MRAECHKLDILQKLRKRGKSKVSHACYKVAGAGRRGVTTVVSLAVSESGMSQPRYPAKVEKERKN